MSSTSLRSGHTAALTQQEYHHRHRDRSKGASSSSYASVNPPPPPRRESSDPARLITSAATADSRVPGQVNTRPTRPTLSTRAYSAPLMPKVKTGGSAQELHLLKEAAARRAAVAAGAARRGQDASDGDDTTEEEDEDSEDEDEEDIQQDIADDPFFQRYSVQDGLQQADGGAQHEEDDDASSEDADTDTENGPLSPTSAGATMRPRPDSILEPLVSPISPNTRSAVNQWFDPSSRMQEINIAVLGSSSVGKSTFIQRAFNLSTLPDSPFNQRKNSIDGHVYVVRLIEIDFEDLDVDEDERICWPEQISGHPCPVLDGAFMLYDVMNKGSLAQMPELLVGIYNSSIPFILVASKCDNPASRRLVDPSRVNQQAKAIIGEVNTFHTTYNDADSQKRCVAVLLRAVASVRNNHVQLAAARRRAHSSALQSPALSSTAHKHNRAASEFAAPVVPRNRTEPQLPSITARSKSSQQLASLPTRRGPHDFDATPDTDSGEFEHIETPKPETSPAPPVLQKGAEVGYTFQELVDRLLGQPMSKADTKYIAIFLALYRNFAAPGQLLEIIFQRFNAVDREDSPQLVKAQIQLRQLNVLSDWISTYPGDFAHPTTRRRLDTFINKLAPIRLFSIAARELTANLEIVVEDDDTDWAFCDRNRERSVVPITNMMKDMVGVAITGSDAIPLSPTARSASTSGTTTSSSQTLLNIVESAQRQAKLIEYHPRIPLSKFQWRMLVMQPEEAIARELTRMDWIMFQSIRPRDLIRHVSLSSSAKSRCRSLENVQRMIDHFNHVAFWVTNYVLLREKPKHRAMMLEKFMKVARELRKLNNYNSLGAVVAGINSTAVHRLQSTKELLTSGTAKDFMKLEILMSSQKSHSAYRLAWENTPNERIPYLPLHRRDLVSASEGNKTFLGLDDSNQNAEEVWLRQGKPAPDARINWKKFEIMGEVVVSVQRAQALPYAAQQVGKNEEVRQLVCETEIVKDEDGLYDRSCAHEPSGAGGNKRRFQFF